MSDTNFSPSTAFDRLRQRTKNSDFNLILVTVFVIYALFTLMGIILFPTNDFVGAMASLLQSVTKWAALYAILALALNLHWGYAGLFNLGVAGFMAIGVYTMAIFYNPATQNPPGLGVPFLFSDVFASAIGLPGWGFAVGLLVCVILGMLAAALIGGLVALPALRLRADYLAIVTLSLSEIIRLSLLSPKFQNFILFNNLDIEIGGVEILPDLALGTGAGQGINLPMNPVRHLYYLDPTNPSEGTTGLGSFVFNFTKGLGIRQSVVVNWTYTLLILIVSLVAIYWLLSRIGNSPFGRVLKAIREDKQVAQALGKDTRIYKIKVFMVGCALMGLGGILWEAPKGFTDPTSATLLPLQTFFIFIALIIGGAGSNTGSVIGGALFAGLLFEGPLVVMQIMNNTFNLGSMQAPSNFADALGALVALDPQALAFFFEKRFAFRYILVGVVLIVLLHRRPTGILGHRKEEASSIDLMERSAEGGETHE